MSSLHELPERLASVVADPRSYANWDALHEDLTNYPLLAIMSILGAPTRTVTNFVGGLKSVPIRFSV